MKTRWQVPHQRLKALLWKFLLLLIAIASALYGLRHNIHAYITPKMLKEDPKLCQGRFCRLGGFVGIKSVRVEPISKALLFRVLEKVDDAEGVWVKFSGALPPLFKEGKLMLAEGEYQGGVFLAERILAKHDENYTPKKSA